MSRVRITITGGARYKYSAIQCLRKRSQNQLAEKEVHIGIEKLKKKNIRNGFYHYQSYQLNQEKAVLTLAQKRSGSLNLQMVSEELTISYLSEIIRHSSTLMMHQSMSRHTYDLKSLEAALQLVESNDYQNIPAIAIHLRIYKALNLLEQNDLQASEHEFVLLKNLIARHWHQFPNFEIRDIYLFTINYCIKRLNTGERRFIREAFELFRSGIQNKTLLDEQGFLSTYSYKNITRIGMALQEEDWVQQFLADYKKQLPPRERENTWRYNLAFFHFQKRNYQDAMQLLQQVDFKDTLNNLDARRMLLRSYFELEEYNALDSLLDSFNIYIYRQKDIGYHRENYLNLVRFVKKLIHLNKANLQEWETLKKEIQKTPRVAEKEWLLKQLN